LVDQGAHGFIVDTLARYGASWTWQQFRVRVPLLRLGRIALG